MQFDLVQHDFRIEALDQDHGGAAVDGRQKSKETRGMNHRARVEHNLRGAEIKMRACLRDRR